MQGRADELQTIGAVLEDARGGRARSLLLTGEPGIGKTTLLEAGRELATGFTVVATAGIEAEGGVPFAGLVRLTRPLTAAIERLPGYQSDVLRSALALAPPAGDGGLAVPSALLGLFATAAEDGPLLVTVDDVQWIDAASLYALLFATRRLDADQVAILLGSRPTALPLLAGLDRLELELLAPAAADAVVHARAPGLSPAARSVIVDAAGGNPLALVELTDALPEGQRAGRDPVVGPLSATPRLGRAFADRLALLPDDGRTALALVAVGGDATSAQLSAAAGVLHIDLRAGLDAGEAHGLVRRRAGTVDVTHPLVRSAVLAELPPHEQRRAHAALAAAYDPTDDPDGHAWHLARSAVEPDAATAAIIEAAGARAAARGDLHAAVEALTTAAALATGAEQRGRCLLEAGRAAGMAGLDAESLLVRALADLPPEAHPDVHVLRVVARFFGGDAAGAIAIGDEQLGGLAHLPWHAAIMAGFLLATAWNTGDFSSADPYRAALEAVVDEAPPPHPLAAVVAATGTWCALVDGDFATFLERHDRALARIEPGANDDLAVPVLLSADMAGRLDAGLAMAERLLEGARRRGVPATVAWLLATDGMLLDSSGRLTEAEAALVEAESLATDAGVPFAAAFARSHLALCMAHRGLPGAAAAAREAGAFCQALGLHGHTAFTQTAEAVAGLCQGDVAAAADLMVRNLDAFVARAGPPARYVDSGITMVGEALALADDPRAPAVLAELEANLLGNAPPATHLHLARARAILAEGDIDAAFAPVHALARTLPSPWQRGFTHLCHGLRLRRAGERRGARDQLRMAMDLFDACDAPGWSERAAVELEATGARLNRKSPHDATLTPRERSVALLAAGGRTNAEIARGLFVSVKTVETHLSRVYRKLDVRSRVELANRLRADPATRS